MTWQHTLLSSTFTAGLIGSLIGWWIGGFSQQALGEQSHHKPNEGIRRCVYNSLLAGLPVGLAFIGLGGGLILWLGWRTEAVVLLINWTLIGLIIALIVVLLNGGYAWLQHMVLRLVLSWQGWIPWNYSRFLDEAVERLLLRKVGGGYIFVHSSLLEYFASLEDKKGS